MVVDSEGIEKKVPPCFDFLTEGDLLTEAGIPWAYYAATQYQNGYLWSAYDAIRHIREDEAYWQSHIFPVDGFAEQARSGLLPPVTWVTPRFELSEHPEYSMCHGENWTTEIVNAVMEGPDWDSTAIFITWDDYGGSTTTCPPPQVDDFGFGIRVPLLVISPYAKEGFVTHELGEFSSVLRFIEDNWRLTQLTHRDRDATPLLSAFDFEQAPRAAGAAAAADRLRRAAVPRRLTSRRACRSSAGTARTRANCEVEVPYGQSSRSGRTSLSNFGCAKSNAPESGSASASRSVIGSSPNSCSMKASTEENS